MDLETVRAFVAKVLYEILYGSDVLALKFSQSTFASNALTVSKSISDL